MPHNAWNSPARCSFSVSRVCVMCEMDFLYFLLWQRTGLLTNDVISREELKISVLCSFKLDFQSGTWKKMDHLHRHLAVKCLNEENSLNRALNICSKFSSTDRTSRSGSPHRSRLDIRKILFFSKSHLWSIFHQFNRLVEGLMEATRLFLLIILQNRKITKEIS